MADLTDHLRNAVWRAPEEYAELLKRAADELEWLRQRIGDMRNTIADLELRAHRGGE